MSQADLELNRDVRKVFVRHWIDLGKISFRSSNGKISIRGALYRIAGVQEELTSTLVEGMFAEIRRLRGVANVQAEFENWVYLLGKWQSADDVRGRQTAPGAGTAQTPAVHQIDGNPA